MLGPAVSALLAGTGKRADPAAVERLRELIDADARALATELQKLVAFVGDRKVIEVADVNAVVTRVASDPFFALGNAVEARDLAEALAVVDRSIADGGHPIMLLSTVAGTLRRLVVEKERARKVVGDKRIGSAREWESTVFPRSRGRGRQEEALRLLDEVPGVDALRPRRAARRHRRPRRGRRRHEERAGRAAAPRARPRRAARSRDPAEEHP